MKRFFTKKIIITILSIASIFVLWEIAAKFVASPYILPAPQKVIETLLQLTVSGDFYFNIFSTLIRGLLGFIIAFILGITLGIITGLNKNAYTFFRPYIIIFRSTPVISFILLALIWFNVNGVPIFIAALTMFPIISINVSDGIKNIDKELIQMAQVYNISGKRILWGIYFPSISSSIFTGLSNAIGFGWRAIIIGEVLSQPKFGIGTSMQNSQIYLLVAELIAWTFIAVFMGYIFELILRKIEAKIIVWK